MNIKKRNGHAVDFNVEKIHKIINWAIEGIQEVSMSDIEMNTRLNIYEGMSTKEIHNIIIDATSNLITAETPNYQFVAGRLLNYQLRKDVWGGKNPPKFYDFIKHNVCKTKIYDENALEFYSKEEIDKLDEAIDHDRDFIFSYAGIKQLCDKYLIQNRETGQIFETPQFAYMLIAMFGFAAYPKSTRLSYVKRAYNYFSKHKINLPTPIMAGVRSNLKSFASCCLIDVDDTMDSIFASVAAAGKATSKRYGIGLNIGRIRGINTPIRGGEVIHTGVIPFLKVFESTVKSCHQNSIRGGGATVNIPIWHYEIEDVLVLKNNAGTEDNRVKRLDYCIGLSKLFYNRLQRNENITLFSTHEVRDLYDAFGHPEFDDLYVKYEKSEAIKYKKVVAAKTLFSSLVKERIETGRIYIMNVDHANEHGAWLDDVKMSNLCLEVHHPLTPLKSFEDKDAQIGVCILSAINLLEINSDAEFEKVCDVTIRFLDEIIDYQTYFNQAAENFAKKRRSLGVGVTNVAAVLAKNNLKYDDKDTPNFIDEHAEKLQYYLLKSSCNLAKEKGKCEMYDRTKYSKGILPIDTYKKTLDKIVTRKMTCDWDSLRKDINQYGLRHSTVTALMPVESSSVIQSSTNGIDPVRSIVTYKKSKTGTLPVIVPNPHLKNRYTIAFDMQDNIGYLNVVAAFQKYIDMSISANTFYNYNHYEGKLIPDMVVLKEILYAYSLGVKNLYYCYSEDDDKDLTNTSAPKADAAADDSCSGGACKL